MKKLLASLVLLPLLALAGGGTYTVPAGSTYLVVPAVINTGGHYNTTNDAVALWASNTTYAAGSTVRLSTFAGGTIYTAQAAGVSTNTIPRPGPESVSDGTVTWLRNPTMLRTGLVIQRASGGIATISIAGGSLVFTVDGSTIGLSAPSCYDGAVYVTAAGTNVVVNTITW